MRCRPESARPASPRMATSSEPSSRSSPPRHEAPRPRARGNRPLGLRRGPARPDDRAEQRPPSTTSWPGSASWDTNRRRRLHHAGQLPVRMLERRHVRRRSSPTASPCSPASGPQGPLTELDLAGDLSIDRLVRARGDRPQGRRDGQRVVGRRRAPEAPGPRPDPNAIDDELEAHGRRLRAPLARRPIDRVNPCGGLRVSAPCWSSRRAIPFLAIPVLAFALAILVSGCGIGSSPTAAPSSTPTIAAELDTAAAPSPTPVAEVTKTPKPTDKLDRIGHNRAKRAEAGIDTYRITLLLRVLLRVRRRPARRRSGRRRRGRRGRRRGQADPEAPVAGFPDHRRRPVRQGGGRQGGRR